MPLIRRSKLPPPLFDHLLDRIQERQTSRAQLEHLLEWLDTQPQVPDGLWFKKFPGMTVCGEGELVKTFLLPDQAALG